jgi:hypothetical protein
MLKIRVLPKFEREPGTPGGRLAKTPATSNRDWLDSWEDTRERLQGQVILSEPHRLSSKLSFITTS